MSVRPSSQRSLSEGYDNFQHQQVNYRNRISAVGGAGVSSGNTEAGTVIEPAGGLARGELAELVAIVSEHQIVTHEWQDDANYLPNSCRVTFELTTEPKPQFADPAITAENPVDEPDVNTFVIEEEDAPGTLDTFETEITGAHNFFNDSSGTQSTVDGETYERHELMNYREQFGEGPVMDRHDNLFIHSKHVKDVAEVTGIVNLTGTVSDPIVDHWANLHFVWDVYEE